MKTIVKSILILAVLTMNIHLIIASNNLNSYGVSMENEYTEGVLTGIFLASFTKGELESPQPNYEDLLLDEDISVQTENEVNEYKIGVNKLKKYLADYNAKKAMTESEEDDWNDTYVRIKDLRITLWEKLEIYYESQLENAVFEMEWATDELGDINTELQKILGAIDDDEGLSVHLVQLINTLESVKKQFETVNESSTNIGDGFDKNELEDLVYEVIEEVANNDSAKEMIEKNYDSSRELEDQIINTLSDFEVIKENIIEYQILQAEAEENSDS